MATKNYSLEKIIYGPDGTSGLLCELRIFNVFDEKKAQEAIEAIEKLVKETKANDAFPSNDMAALCDMCIDLALNKDKTEGVSDFLFKLIRAIDQWYDE